MSDQTADPALHPGTSFATLAGGAVGNLIEWYDWTVYGLLSAVFAGQFFPAGDPTAALLAVLATFALGFLMRPVGSIVLSPVRGSARPASHARAVHHPDGLRQPGGCRVPFLCVRSAWRRR